MDEFKGRRGQPDRQNNDTGTLYAQSSVRVSTGAGGSCVVTPLYSLTAPQTAPVLLDGIQCPHSGPQKKC